VKQHKSKSKCNFILNYWIAFFQIFLQIFQIFFQLKTKKKASSKYRVSQKWRTNYLLPYRGCLNVHEKNVSDKKFNYFYPSATRRHGNFAGVHTLLGILLSSNSAVLINIITGVSPPHFDFVVYCVLCQC
jgi:hypothetical protein